MCGQISSNRMPEGSYDLPFELPWGLDADPGVFAWPPPDPRKSQVNPMTPRYFRWEGRSQMVPSGGTRSVADAGCPCQASSVALTLPRLPTPEPE